ncbi:MAG: M81 family metallopeptidase [Rubrivivax sp.]|nr:M81 family metallopeptidase [Rubrivivax sp.]
MRVFTATLATETNTFAPMPTGLASYRERGYYKAGTHPEAMSFFAGPLWAARQRARRDGWTLIEGMVAAAQPSGTTTREAWDTLREELLADLRAALPVDMVLLGLHGAMVADGCDDCEGELLRLARGIVGPKAVVGAELDLHHHLTDAMVRNADLLVAFKEYPHTDVAERALELVDLCSATVRGEIRPQPAVVDTGMVLTIHTTREPGRGLVQRMQALEGQGGVLSVSLAHGFPWGDVEDMGTKVLVYTDRKQDPDGARGRSVAQALCDEVSALRDRFSPEYLAIDAALDAALAEPGAGDARGPVVIADKSDNPGGGAAGDSTFILRRVLERGITRVAMAPLWDPLAVRIAFEAGAGARLPLRLGGKVGPMSGDPVDADCTVVALKHEMVMTGLGGTPMALGDCALVEMQGVQVVLISQRNQAMGTDLFTGLGVDLTRQRVVVVKSSQHFHAAYAPIASRVIYADAPGSVSTDLSALPYRKVRRPRWPI